MRIESPPERVGGGGRAAGVMAVTVLLLWLVPWGSPLVGQESGRESDGGPSLFLVNAETRVGSLGWRFPSGAAVEPSSLRDHVALRGPGSFVWLRSALDFLPGISGPQYAPFSPLVLQRDVVRLRKVYRDAGFPHVEVDYEVALDTANNRVSVTMVVDQGRPLVIDSVEVDVVEAADGAVSAAPRVELPEELRDEWASFLEELGDARGERFSQEERSRLANRTTDWFRERGYPWASVSVAEADTTDLQVSVRLTAAPGTRARVREVRIEGNERLSRNVLAREIPIEPGDWYEQSRVADGQQELYQLDIVRQALGDVVQDESGDSTVVIRYRVSEGLPHLVWGRIGWRSESGVGGEAHWQHRDFFGGARTFTASTSFESGWASLEANSLRTVGVSLLVRQPYVYDRKISASVGPFARFRDDFRDRSFLFGLETSLIYRQQSLETMMLQHELSRLRVDDTHQLTPLKEVIEQGDSVFAPIFVKSIFKLRGTYGTLDDRINPSRGYLVESNLEVSGPTGVSDVEFFRAGLKAMTIFPLSRHLSLFARASAGRLFPFGESDPGSDAPRTRAVVGIRDAMFTAGGTNDVRGWGNGLLGSKIPDVGVAEDGTVVASRFVPAGGLARITGTVELGLPFPFLRRPHRTFLFLDGGRVWSPGEAFDPGDPELRREGWAFGTGGGMEFGTLVGPIRIAVGYKMNPLPVDLLLPGEVARAIIDDVPLEELETESFRRWHLHFSIGRSF